MSRWAHDPDAAADALIGRSLDAVDLSGRILLANPSGGLPAMLAARGVACELWQRRLQAGGSAQAWPPAGPFDLAIMRLAKAKDEQEMAAHAVLSVLGPEALLLLYGGNDEGIRSAAAVLEGLCGSGTHCDHRPARPRTRAGSAPAEAACAAAPRPWPMAPGDPS